MAKETGLGWTTLSVKDAAGTLRAIINDITNFDFSTPRAIQDVTGVDKLAMERLHLLADMSLNLTGVFNDAANQSHDVFKSLANARDISIQHSGQTLGVTPQVQLLFTDYAMSRAQNGGLTWTAPGVLANGVVPTWT